MKRISRWPARMLANSRTDSEMSRTKCEITSITKIGTGRGALDAGGDPALQVADEALRPDALDVVADPHDERQRERHREVRRRRVERERRDLERRRCSTLCSVFVGSGR